MTTEIRAWRIDDAPALAENLNNKKIHDNLRDGLPYPYTEKDAENIFRLCFRQIKTSRLRLQ